MISTTQADSDDPFYELRFYRVASGRQHDMDARVRHDLRRLFARHEVAPAGAWNLDIGAAAPQFIYLTPWRNMQMRSRSWAGFYADPDWAEARNRTNAGQELVESYDIYFLRAVLDWQAGPGQAGVAGGDAMPEMMIRSIAVGHTAPARAEVLEHVIPLLREGGAVVHGVFDVMSGCSLPAFVFFIDWGNAARRRALLARLDARIAVARAPGGGPLLGRADHYLLSPFDLDGNTP